ncbi:MAG: FAD-binding protein [Bacteriovoracales bacterium]
MYIKSLLIFFLISNIQAGPITSEDFYKFVEGHKTILEESNLKETEKKEISQKISNLQSKLDKRVEDEIFSCPFCHLATSCGNRICDQNEGENERNCFEDCSIGPYRSYNGQTICKQVQEVFSPKNEVEVQNLIKKAIKDGKRVKVIGRKHSDNGGICTDGITIATDKLNKIFGVENFEGNETVKVGPGATMFEVNQWLHKINRSVGFAVPSYRSVTVGGVIANAVHGSSPYDTSILSSLLASAKMVMANGEIKEFSEKNSPEDIFKAIKVNLGLLGVITEFRLKIRPQFNMEVKTTYLDEEDLWENGGVQKLYKGCDWIHLHWFPRVQEVMKSCGKVVKKPAMKGATNKLIGENAPEFLMTLTKMILQYGSTNSWAFTFLENFRWLAYQMNPPFEIAGEDGKPESAHSLVGNSHMLQASEYASFESRTIRTRDFELAFPSSQMVPALKASQKYFEDNEISIPLTGLFIRFSKVDDETLLSLTSSGGEFKLGSTAMYTELTYFKPAGLNPAEMEAYESVYADWAKLMISKYHARVHWAKNKPFAFSLERNIGSFQDKWDRFQKVIDELDPKGIFSNDFGRSLGFTWKDRK